MVYVEVKATEINIFEKSIDNQEWRRDLFPLPNGFFSSAGCDKPVKSLGLPKKKGASVILAANTRECLVRITDIPEIAKMKKISDTKQWEFVRRAFPFGETINENTHIFDGCVFSCGDESPKYFITALPMRICDLIAEIGLAVADNIMRVTRIETVEHLLIRRYADDTKAGTGLLFLLPQGESVRGLYIENGMPHSSFLSSMEQNHRALELARFYAYIKKGATARIKAVVLDSCDKNLGWVAECGFETEFRRYDFRDLL